MAGFGWRSISATPPAGRSEADPVSSLSFGHGTSNIRRSRATGVDRMAARAVAVLMVLASATGVDAQPVAEPRELPQFTTTDSNGNAFGPLLPRNRPTDVRGVQAVCTGVDSDSRADPRWPGYP